MTFRILASQMEALGQDTQRRFRRMMEHHIAEHCGSFVASLAEPLGSWVATSLERAHRHHIVTEPEVAQLLLLWTHVGRPDGGEADPILDHEHLNARGKLRRLLRDALARDPGVARVIAYPHLLEDR